MRASPDQRSPQRCTKAFTGNHGRYAWPTSNTQKGFSSCTHTTVLTHSCHQKIPSNSSRTFPEHHISLGALGKETLASPERAIGSRPKHTSSRYHSRHYIANAG